MRNEDINNMIKIKQYWKAKFSILSTHCKHQICAREKNGSKTRRTQLSVIFRMNMYFLPFQYLNHKVWLGLLLPQHPVVASDIIELHTQRTTCLPN
jgi:hypothetical protein